MLRDQSQKKKKVFLKKLQRTQRVWSERLERALLILKVLKSLVQWCRSVTVDPTYVHTQYNLLRGTKFSNRGWRHRQSWFFAKCFSFREHFNNEERRKLPKSFCACFLVLDLKYVITNVSRKVFFQHDMRAGTSTDLFQNNKICTTPRSKICSGDVHVLDLFPIFTPLLKYCAS